MLTPAYVAGLFDGEGSASLIYVRVRAWKSDPSKAICQFKLAASLSNTHTNILEMLKSQYAGNISRSARETGVERKIVRQWRITSAIDQLRFFNDIQPFCIIKSEQIALAMEYLETMTGRGQHLTQDVWERRITIFEKMRSLNKRGVAKPSKNEIPQHLPVGRKFYSPQELDGMIAESREERNRAA